jgi:hypothetical protein
VLRFQPEEMLRTLERHQVRYVVIGGIGATLHGSPLPTRDTDICPEPGDLNLERLAAALREMDARIRAPDAPTGLPFTCDAAFLRQMKLLNLTTRFGDLDLRTATRTGRPCPHYGSCSKSSVPGDRSLPKVRELPRFSRDGRFEMARTVGGRRSPRRGCWLVQNWRRRYADVGAPRLTPARAWGAAT